MDGRAFENLNNDGEEKFFNFRPCLFLAVFLWLGIVFAWWCLKNGVSAWWSVSVFGVSPLLFAYFKRKRALWIGFALALSFIVGVFSYTVRADDFSNTQFYHSYDSILYGRVLNRTVDGETTCLLLDDLSIDGKAEKGKLVAYLPTSSCENIRLSDLVFVRGWFESRTELFGKDATFAEYFADDIRFCVNAEKISVSGHKFDAFAEIKEVLRSRLCEGMGEETTSVAFAILTGDSSGINDGLLDGVRRGGGAHIFAVSGLHIGTLYALCIFLFGKIRFLKGRKILSFSLVALVLLFYGGVCGYTESVLRAVIMCLVLYASNLIGVKRDTVESISFASILLLIINPASLFCVGFLLSFVACYGIAFLGKPLQVWLEKKYRLSTGRESEYPVSYAREGRGKTFSFLGVTIGAQVSTAPILLNAYGYLSGWGFFLNAIFVPCVGFVFSVTLGCAFLAMLLPSVLSTAILWLPNLLWTVVLLIFYAFEFPVIFNGVTLNGAFIFCYYALLIVLSGKFNLRRNEKIALILIFASLCISAFVI